LPASDDAACVHCGKSAPDMPVLARGGHAWLHRDCWAPMDAKRGRGVRRSPRCGRCWGLAHEQGRKETPRRARFRS
jgi:hypothetical protein